MSLGKNIFGFSKFNLKKVTVIAIQVAAAIKYLIGDVKSGRFDRRSIVSKLKKLQYRLTGRVGPQTMKWSNHRGMILS
jgi:hypothetical protein